MLPYINGNKKIIKRYKGTQLVYQVEGENYSEIDFVLNSLPQGFNIGGYTETATTTNTIDNGDGTYTYKSTLNDFGITELTTYQQSFQNSSLTKINSLPFSNTITNVMAMFSGCASLSEVNAKGWDISNVTSYILMFHNCNSLNKLILGSVSQSTYDWWVARLTDASIQNNVTIEATIV